MDKEEVISELTKIKELLANEGYFQSQIVEKCIESIEVGF